MKTMLILVSLFILGCGNSMPCDESRESCASSKEAAAEPTSTNSDPFITDKSVTLRGYVSSAFDLTVDGQHFTDSEDFYTQQLDKLTAEAEADYAGWNLSFDAEIGLEDLKYNMRVFVASVNSRGFAGESWVDENGQFSLEFPDAGESTYKIRATKRITLILTEPETDKEVRWCYNFSAVEQPVSLNPKDNRPIILSTFVTGLTKYECVNENSGGITIPTRK